MPIPTVLEEWTDTPVHRPQPDRDRGRKHLLIAVLVAAAAVATAVAVLIVGGSADQPVASAAETAVRAPEARPDPTPAPQEPAEVAVPVEPPAPAATYPAGRDAAIALYAAWQSGDPGAAALAATPEAVDSLFARPFVEGAWTGSECENRAGGDVDCFIDGDEEALIITASPDATTGYQVTSVGFESLIPDLTVAPAPAAAPVGATVHIEGEGFFGEPWTTPAVPLYLVGNLDARRR